MLPALALVSLIPLVLSLLMGTPGMLRTAEPAAPAASSEVVVAPDPTAEEEPEVALQLEVPALTAAEAMPPILKPIPTAPASPRPNVSMGVSRPPAQVVSTPFTPILSLLRPPQLVTRQGGPSPLTAEDIISAAEKLMGVPYVWGGTSDRGLDCSAFISRVWGVSRRTTESLPGVAFRIAKEELLPGDILNLTIGQDPRGYGHVRLFAGWANTEHSRMWVYEETPPRSLHRVIAYDNRYTPLRRINYSPGNLAASHLLNMLFGKADTSVAAPADDPGTTAADEDDEDEDDSVERISTAPVPQGHAKQEIEQRALALTLPAEYKHDWAWSPLPRWTWWQAAPLPRIAPPPAPSPRTYWAPSPAPIPVATPQTQATEWRHVAEVRQAATAIQPAQPEQPEQTSAFEAEHRWQPTERQRTKTWQPKPPQTSDSEQTAPVQPGARQRTTDWQALEQQRKHQQAEQAQQAARQRSRELQPQQPQSSHTDQPDATQPTRQRATESQVAEQQRQQQQAEQRQRAEERQQADKRRAAEQARQAERPKSQAAEHHQQPAPQQAHSSSSSQRKSSHR